MDILQAYCTFIQHIYSSHFYQKPRINGMTSCLVSSLAGLNLDLSDIYLLPVLRYEISPIFRYALEEDMVWLLMKHLCTRNNKTYTTTTINKTHSAISHFHQNSEKIVSSLCYQIFLLSWIFTEDGCVFQIKYRNVS